RSSKLALLARRKSALLSSTSVTFALLLGVHVAAPAVRAQQSAEGAASDKQTIQMLLHRLEQLEARVTQLEAARQTTPTTAAAQAQSAPATQSTPSSEVEPETPAHAMERMDTSNTLMRIRGFGDINFHGGDQRGTT